MDRHLKTSSQHCAVQCLLPLLLHPHGLLPACLPGPPSTHFYQDPHSGRETPTRHHTCTLQLPPTDGIFSGKRKLQRRRAYSEAFWTERRKKKKKKKKLSITCPLTHTADAHLAARSPTRTGALPRHSRARLLLPSCLCPHHLLPASCRFATATPPSCTRAPACCTYAATLPFHIYGMTCSLPSHLLHMAHTLLPGPGLSLSLWLFGGVANKPPCLPLLPSCAHCLLLPYIWRKLLLGPLLWTDGPCTDIC